MFDVGVKDVRIRTLTAAAVVTLTAIANGTGSLAATRPLTGTVVRTIMTTLTSVTAPSKDNDKRANKQQQQPQQQQQCSHNDNANANGDDDNESDQHDDDSSQQQEQQERKYNHK